MYNEYKLIIARINIWVKKKFSRFEALDFCSFVLIQKNGKSRH
jgi:hypothetical protein